MTVRDLVGAPWARPESAPTTATGAAPRWERPAFAGLLVVTAVLYLWNLSASGWANSFYSAAVQAGTRSWEAFFFGSSDASNFITVDKPPVSLWAMELSARVFGLSSWSVLAPQAIAGVAAVAVLYLTVRRWFSPQAALIAGAVLALTPVATLMFRFNNPDALLVLLLTAGAYATVRAIERGRTGWLVLAAALVGTGFLTKMLQAYLVLPAFAAVFLLAAPTPLRARVRSLIWAAVALVVSSGWWVAAVALTPAADRPYVGGSQDNSILNLIFGYNGFGRLTGNESGSVGGGGNAAGRWGATGWERLFGNDMGGQIAWLIPAALIVLAAGLWITRRRPRTDRTRAALVLFGGWLLVTGVVFSYAQGIIHPYYTVALAPAIGALVGIGVTMLWQRRSAAAARLTLAVAGAVTAVWAYVLLERTPSYHPELRIGVLGLGLTAALAVALIDRFDARRATAIALAAVALGLAAPAAFSITTATTAYAGAIPSAGPATGFGGGAPPGQGAPGGAQGLRGAPPAGMPAGGFGTPPAGGFGTPPAGGAGMNRAGGLLQSSTPSAALVRALQTNAARYTWVAATVGSNSASGYQLATGDPVMAIGGFNGTDPAPTLAQFIADVRQGKIHYFIAGGGMGMRGSGNSDIAAWVKRHYSPTTIGGVTLYDLTA